MHPQAWQHWYSSLHRASALSQQARSPAAVRVRLERARALLEAQYTRPLDLDTLAKQAFYSRYHFLRAYRQAFGVTPHQHLTQVRLQAARHLLEDSDLPVTEVCLAVGFTSLGSFSALFKRHTGRSPDHWRRRIYPAPGLVRPIPACFLARFSRF